MKKNVEYIQLLFFFPALLCYEPIGCRHVWNLQVTIGCGREEGKEAGTTIGSNGDQSSRQEKGVIPGIFTAQSLSLLERNI